MGRLYLIRHAQSANNVAWDGSDFSSNRVPDPEITDLGHVQARALAQHLADPVAEPRQPPLLSERSTHFGITHLYCSLMTRSILTAEYIAESLSLDLEAWPDIFEQHGLFEMADDGEAIGIPGPDRHYFNSRFPGLRLPQDINESGWWSRAAETTAEFIVRVARVAERLQDRLSNSDECIALVVHGDFMDQILNHIMAVDRYARNYTGDWVANWVFHNTSLTRIDYLSGSRNVVYLNRIDHLSGQLISW